MIYGVITAKQGGDIFLDTGVKDEDKESPNHGKVVPQGPYNVAPPVKVVKGEWNEDPKQSFTPAHQNDLSVGTKVALHGPPSGELHTVRIIEDDGKVKTTHKAKAHASHSHAHHKAE